MELSRKALFFKGFAAFPFFDCIMIAFFYLPPHFTTLLYNSTYDNAVMECFFKYLKMEEINRKSYSSYEELSLSLFEYINGFYNFLRPCSHNNGLSPNMAENLSI